MAEAVSAPERPALSRDLGEFLIEFSVALHKHAMYPAGHPSLGPAVARVVERATRLLEQRPTFAFGVARQQLIIDGVATDPRQPVLRRLAEELHRHHLGAISIVRGIEADEVTAALRALSVELGPDDTPLGLAPGGEVPRWTHVRLHPLTLDRLQLISDEDSSGEKASGRGADLWIGLASAAVATDSGHVVEDAPTDPSEVAKAIDEHEAVEAYDQVIVGYLLQIADELKGASSADVAALRRRTARLISALRPETLQRLIEMGGDAAQRHAFLRSATNGMAVSSVVKILKAAAGASGQTISHGLTRMLSKLAAHAELGQPNTRPFAEGALREQVDRLLDGWTLEDPNPEAYSRVLQHLATTAPVQARTATRSRLDDANISLRIVQMGLEIGESGPLVDRAIESAIRDIGVRSLRELLTSPPQVCGAAADALRTRLRDARTIASIIGSEPLDLESLDALLPSTSIDGYAVMLDALIASQNRTTRRKLLDRLSRAHLDIRSLIVSHVDDDRWYVTRNMLLLLERLAPVPSGFSAAPWARHPDARVRYQALSVQITNPEEREWAVGAALEDPDARVTRLGLLAVQRECPEWALPLVVRVATNPRAMEELRIYAVQALAGSRDRAALDALVRLIDGGRTLLGRPRLAPGTPVVVAATRALAETWPTDARAREMLALALKSSEPQLRQAVRQGRI